MQMIIIVSLNSYSAACDPNLTVTCQTTSDCEITKVLLQTNMTNAKHVPVKVQPSKNPGNHHLYQLKLKYNSSS